MGRGIRLTDILIIIVFFIGASVLAYPTVSNLWNEYRNERIMSTYTDTVSEISDEEKDLIWEKAKEYNEMHQTNTVVEAFADENEYELSHPYDQMLNPTGDNIMGSIYIPKIHCNLVIYHGIGADALENGCGHIEGTSLPVGGKGTHAVLAGHRGLPSAKLFSDLDQIEVGDQFVLTILDKKLAYEVDKIQTVLPSETDGLKIEQGEDLVTLVTCTPYGVNTHRLLVRGHRIPYEAEQFKDASDNGIDFGKLSIILLIIGILIVIIIALIIKRKMALDYYYEDEDGDE